MDDELVEFIRCVKEILQDYYRKWRLAEVQDFNKELGEVDVKILGFVRDETNNILGVNLEGEPQDIILNNVPVRIFGNSNNFISHSIEKGDICELHRIDYDISDYIADGTVPEGGFVEDYAGQNWIACFTIRHNKNSIPDWKDGIEINAKGNLFHISEKGEAIIKCSSFLRIENKFDVIFNKISLLEQSIKDAETSSELVATLIANFKTIAEGFNAVASLVPACATTASAITAKEKDLQNSDKSYKDIAGNIKIVKA